MLLWILSRNSAGRIVFRKIMVRTLEFLISLLSLIFFLPLFIIIGILIKIDSQGPVLYASDRAGKYGKQFKMYKFRTMIHNVKNLGPPITIRGDDRITAMGCFLRKTKLDELPQLINVFLGNMGFVGARPEDLGIVYKHHEIFKEILKYRPGITSPASIYYKFEESLIPEDNWEVVYQEEILPRKIIMDLAYMQNASFIKDIGIILVTIGILKKYPVEMI